MTTVAIQRLRCQYRPILLGMALVSLLCLFWFASRYPQLWAKSQHVGDELASMAYGKERFAVSETAVWWEKIFWGSLNWLDTMKIGMSFGVAAGALLHTILKYYPLKIGNNLYLNSLQGALVGVPMGVCANCSVPVACGVTRGHGRVEVALGFLFSSPNFNPIVVMMSLAALPWPMNVAKFAALALLIVLFVPWVIGRLQREKPFDLLTSFEAESCTLPSSDTTRECLDTLPAVAAELFREWLRHVWMLLKPTIAIMLLMSIASATLLAFVPWKEILAEPTPLRMLVATVLSVFMPVPIALDVMFAALLQKQGVSPGYVMMFAMTLGPYSIVPSIYLWREVSRRLSVILFVFFIVLGWCLGMAFA